MDNVRIVTDSACDLPQELADELSIVIVPLSIRIGADEFIDREQLSTAEFWKRCADVPTLPETSAPAPGRFEAAYRGLAADGATGIVVVALSSDLSATMQDDKSLVEAQTKVKAFALAFRDAVNANPDFLIYKTLVGFDCVYPPAWEDAAFHYREAEAYRAEQVTGLLASVDGASRSSPSR